MSVRLTRMETLTVAWDSDEHVLRRWGNEGQANVVAVCRGLLVEELGKEGAPRLGMLLRVWKDDAAVLETFGHGDEAETLRRCVEELRLAVGAGEGSDADRAAQTAASGSPDGTGRSAGSRLSRDGSAASTDRSKEEAAESSGQGAWTK